MTCAYATADDGAMRSWQSFGLSTLILCACGDDASGGGEGSTGSTGNTPSSTSSSTTPDASSSSNGTTNSVESSSGGADSSSDGGFKPTDPMCGNGFVEEEEQCDDANEDDNDGCTSACEFQCGLQWSSLALAPTDQSLLNPRGVARGAAGATAVVGFQREITTDQRGNETAEDDVAAVVLFDEAGRALWSVTLSEDDVDVEAAGIAVDDAGDVYVSATVGAAGADDSDIYLYKLAGASGEVMWTFVQDSAVDGSQDFAFDVAVAPDGAPVISGQVRVGDGDDDVWAAEVDAATGMLVWDSTWSGEAAGGFSTDDGGPVAVGPAGEVYVFAREYVNFESSIATLIRFGPEGGEALSDYSPVVEGGQQNYLPLDVSTSSQGDVLVTFVRLLGAGDEYYVARLDEGNEPEAWRIGTAPIAEAIEDTGTSEYVFVAAEFGQDDAVVATGSLERTAKGATWIEPWVARLQDDATVRCQFVQPSPQLSLVPGSLIARGLDVSADEDALIAAQQIEDGVQALWLGSFRP